jgi:hypothetical protein
MGKEKRAMILTNVGLTHEQENILAQSGSWLAEQGFYLAVGTALTIYYGHRRSVDLDWFTPHPIPDAFILAQRLRDSGLAFGTGQTAPGTLCGQVGNVRVSFIEFRYPLLQPLEIWHANGSALASLDDLACMKLSAVAQRGSRKDFYDVHTLISRHCPLPEMLRLYQQKFSVHDIAPVLYGLAYFDDADQEPEAMLLNQIAWKQVKREILQWLKAATN